MSWLPQPASAAQHAAWAAGTLPAGQPHADGIWSLVIPVPELPVRYTYCYALEAGDGLVVVDPGWDGVGGTAPLERALGAIGRTLDDIVGIVVTHGHRDHIGIAGALRSRRGPTPWLAMHRDEAGSADGPIAADFRRQEGGWLELIGAPHDQRGTLRIPAEGVRSIIGTPRADRLLVDGELLPLPGRRLRVVATPGHTPGSICLHDEDAGLILTGDTLLPRISPNIGWLGNGHADPLGDYLESLAKLAAYDDAVALPGHEWSFTGVAGRASTLAAHHLERLDEVRELVDGGLGTVWDVARTLRWRRPWVDLSAFQRRIASAEAAAHLIHLVTLGRLTETAPSRFAA